jgi:peptidoglycan/LPS O-acetylase OafA/YrhL
MLKPTHPGIVGLRAIAVLAVVLFHFFPGGVLSGGFVGVDIFFVISGFLIARTIYTDVARNRFSITAFYERRARRILPAFFAVSLATTIAAYFVLLPYGFNEFAKSLLAAALFVPNLFFYFTSDYFAPAASQLPLLHYWSLGVEEQFYLAFPILVAAVLARNRKALAPILVLLFAASSAASVLTLRNSLPAAFYLPWNRAFEVLIGALLALPGVRLARGWIATAASVVGLALLAISIAALGNVPFPGSAALLPCFGAALVVWGSHNQDSALARAIGSKPLRFVSDISYSLYLIHWPVAVFGAMLFTGPLVAWCGLGLSIALSAASYRFVEQPVRLRTILPSRFGVAAGSALGLVLVAAMSLFVISNAGFAGRIGGRVNDLLATLQYDPKEAFQSGTCFMQPVQDPGDYDLAKCIPTERPLAILWGDSHLSQYLWGLRPLFEQRGFALAQFGSSGCAPALGVDTAARPKCRAFNDFAVSEILRLHPTLVVLGAVWAGSSEQLEGLGRSIRALQGGGIKVVVFGNAPFYKDPVPSILAKRLLNGDTNLLAGPELEGDFVYKNDAAIRDFVATQTSAAFVSILDTACHGGCLLEYDGDPLHFDIAHVTKEGSDYYASKLFPALVPFLVGSPG